MGNRIGSRGRIGLWTALLMLIIAVGTACEQDIDALTNIYRSDKAVADYLKSWHFDVPAEPSPVFDFEYTLLNGNTERLSVNRGKVVFLNFWATWCYPCRKEMPSLQYLRNEMKGESFRLLAVNYGDSPDRIMKFTEDSTYSFDIILDKDKAISNRLSIKGLPTTMIIDQSGRLLGRLIGPADWEDEAFIRFCKALSRK